MDFITLNDGNKMPILGFGTFQIPPHETARCVRDALECGYRLIDTAQAYGNEKGVGEAVNDAIKNGIKRDELFIETKVWISNSGEAKATKSIDESLKRLGLDYVDLFIIHQPFGDYYGTYRALLAAKNAGKIKSIGVSNFYNDRIDDICQNFSQTPAINQIELHPFFAKFDEQKVCENLGVTVQSWGSFAEGKNDLFKNEILSKIAQKHGKSVAQVVLRWLIGRGIAVIPKSTHIERMRENIAVFDFGLDEDDLRQIATLDTNKTLFIDHHSQMASVRLNGWKI
ncbi:MAG: aldo/keto reductase [Campylobacter sp.]|nr:aldo/keto reductase [Campylobacter sp.]